MKLTSCVILDLQGYELSQIDVELLQHPCVAGVILFTRNYHDLQQLRALTTAIRKQQPTAFIAVDQEGGRVQRFRQDFSILPAMFTWGQQYQHDPYAAKQELAKSIKQLCQELLQVGINLNLIPVLDLNHGMSEMIGERSLHADPAIVTELAKVIIDSLHDCGMPAVGKHFPGHGGVRVDSHIALPCDNRSWSQLTTADLQPFITLANQLDIVMPAHIIFNQCDELLTTYSPFWLQQVLRKQLGFTGVIMSDDLTMMAAALVGDYTQRAMHALAAGIDLLLVCNHHKGAIDILQYLEHHSFNSAQAQRLQLLKSRYTHGIGYRI